MTALGSWVNKAAPVALAYRTGAIPQKRGPEQRSGSMSCARPTPIRPGPTASRLRPPGLLTLYDWCYARKRGWARRVERGQDILRRLYSLAHNAIRFVCGLYGRCSQWLRLASAGARCCRLLCTELRSKRKALLKAQGCRLLRTVKSPSLQSRINSSMAPLRPPPK
jgi:hypothetical protein